MRDKTQNSRRTFMKTAALAGGAATVAFTARAAVTETTEVLPKAQPAASKGYHLTPHIEEYYRLARD